MYPRNKSIVVTNQQGHPKTATNEELKSRLLKKVFLVKVLKRKLLLLQEVKLKYLRLETTIEDENYRICKEILMEKSCKPESSL